ncbi:MAG: GGDEF domain-containing protein [Firmicutes bacterium]|nr:GGDEF domain-containing protein [Bacillota bacterium]
MNEEMLLEEIRAMREEMHAMREQMTDMIGDTNKKLEVIGGFVKAMNEAQTFEKTMKAVENVTKDITGGGSPQSVNAEFIAIEGDRFYTTDGENRNYCTPENIEMMQLVMDDGNVFVDENTAIIPVQSNDNRAVGWIVAEKQGGFEGVDLSQLARGSTVMDTISLAIEKEINHSLAITDELTHLKNRDGLNEYLRNTLAPSFDGDNKACILMCDIDHFKAVNDTYGHQAGDNVLKQVAQILSDNTRNGIDSAFRVGGEEMVCVVGCDTKQATDIAERIRGQIESALFEYEGQEIPVTLSIGVHEMSGEITPQNVKEVFEMEMKSADNALYEAKEGGRNQVVISEESRKREPTFFNKNSYKDIENKAYINCDAKMAYDISQTAQQMNVEHSVKYDGFKSSVVVDGKQNSEFLDYVKSSYQSARVSEPVAKSPHNNEVKKPEKPAQNTNAPKKETTFFNRDGFSQISNKTYVNTDSKTAYNISKAAQVNGVEHSVKYNGDRSTVTFDGVKDRSFLDIIKNVAEWAEKVQIKAAQMKEEPNKTQEAVAR